MLKDCKVPVENVIKGAGNGFPIAMNALDNSRIGIAAQALGIAQGAYEASLKYAHEREAFGKPIAHHQMIMGILADMATELMLPDTSSTRPHGRNNSITNTMAPPHKEASMAKLYAGDTAMWVSKRYSSAWWLRYTKDSRLNDSSEMQKLPRSTKDSRSSTHCCRSFTIGIRS